MRISQSVRRAIGLVILLGACAPNTEVIDSWKDPNIGPQKYQKILGVFISQDASLRRAGEDQLAKRLPNVVPSHSVLPQEATSDRNKARAWIQQQGFDGVVIMRPVKVDKETTYVPGSSYVVPAGYGSMYGYWGTGWGYAYDPGYVRQDEVVMVETNVYNVSSAKLVWASRTKTYNPESVRQLVDEIVNQTAEEMKKQKVVSGS